MALITLRQLLDHAAENDYALPAFNVNNLEYIQAVMRAADATDSPVILQASRGARSYAGDAFLRHLILGAAEEYPHIPVCLHLDHGDQPSTCISAITNGFTSVMMDGSLEKDGKTVASYEYNVAVTAEVVKIAHAPAFRSKANSAASATSRPAPETRKTATASKASCRARNY